MCADIGPYGGTCAHFLTDEVRDIPKEEWDRERFGMVCMRPEYIGDFKAEIEKLCSVTKCTYETKKKIAEAFNRLDLMVSGLRKGN